METDRFGRLMRTLAFALSRRGLVSASGLLVLGIPDLIDARKKKHKRRKKHKKKVRFNAFGCVDVGTFCHNNDQCCSGICTGTNGKKTCKAHDTRGCQLADDTCLQEGTVLCPDAAAHAINPDDAGEANKVLPFCFQTTGKAAFCGFLVGDHCVACSNDADCVADFGAGAACVVCAGFCAESNHTTCLPAELST